MIQAMYNLKTSLSTDSVANFLNAQKRGIFYIFKSFFALFEQLTIK